MDTRVAKQILRTAQETRNNYAVTESEFDKVKANMYSIFECYAHGIIDWDTTKKYFRESLKKYITLHKYENREQEREVMREEYKRVTWEYKNALDAYKVVAEQKLAKNLLNKVEFIGESVAQSQAQKYYTQRMLSESEVRDTATLSWKRVMEAYPNLTAKDEDRVRMLTIFEAPTMDTTQMINIEMDEGYKILPPMDKEKYQPRKGLEGPFSTLSGKVVYYDPKEGAYYDPDTDMYMSYDEFRKYDDDYKDMKESIEDIKKIVADKQASKINGMLVDMFTASAIAQVYDAVNDKNKAAIENMLKTKEGVMKIADFALNKINEGHSPHKKGTKKYKAHMAAMHANSAKPEGKMIEGEENHYLCVHAKKGSHKCSAETSYAAAKKAAEHWGMKSTAGIDAHLMTDESVIEDFSHPVKDFGMFSKGGNAQVQNIIQYTLDDFDDAVEKATNSERDSLRMDAFEKLFSELEDLGEDPKYEEATDTDVRERAAMYLDKGIIRIMNRLDGVAVERKMTKKEKAKEKRLKDKYDDSDMKASMKKQYGDDWKEVYYATIRKKAMENVAGAFASVAQPLGKIQRRNKVKEDQLMTEAQFDEAAGEKDACYHKVKSRYEVWPSAYASGALVQCRKVGAKNWGNKSKKK